MGRVAVITLLLLLCLSPCSGPAGAAEERDGFVFSPPPCDFALTFPEKPYTTRKCREDGSGCSNLTNFTQVFDMRSTVNFRVTCNPSPESALERYGESVMRTVIKGMVDRDSISDYDLLYEEYDQAKTVSLTGMGESGLTPMIYTAQIWVGPNSIFTLEGELIGSGSDEADMVFARILSSVDIPEVSGEREEVPEQEDED